jgi:hypothetical protein
MSDTPTADDQFRPRADAPIEMPAHDRDALISRVVDGCASAEDWDSFRAMAADDQSIWSELAVAQRQYESLSEIVHHASSVADAVDLPGGAVRQQHHQNRLDFVSRWGGWAAAAAILLVWVAGMRAPGDGSMRSGAMTAGMLPSGNKALTAATPDEAMDQYMTAGFQAGRVVGEVPNPVVIETRPMPDGTFEVLYLRQILERKVLSEVYRETNDEFGNAIAVPLETDPKRIKSY